MTFTSKVKLLVSLIRAWTYLQTLTILEMGANPILAKFDLDLERKLVSFSRETLEISSDHNPISYWDNLIL